MLTDFHSHILPEMDDGSSSTEESLKMIRMLTDAGVQRIVLTPHFYRNDENIATFLKRRENAYKKLLSAMQDFENPPEFVLGAEVYFYPSLSSDPDFNKLCIGNTDHMLLELPFEHFYDNFFIDFSKFMNRCNHKILLAHIERYLKFGNTQKEIDRIIAFGGISCQMNCSSLTEASWLHQKKLIKMLNSGTINVLGSDAHNLHRRPPLFKEALGIINKKCSKDILERINDNGNKLLG